MHKDLTPARDANCPIIVWQPWHFNLGDHWATINYLITRSFILREEMLLCRFQHGTDYGERFSEMLRLIQGPERSCVTLVADPATHELNGFDVWATPYWPTAHTWQPTDRHAGIAYQFDGLSSAEAKNPPMNDVPGILNTMGELGDPLIQLGRHQTLTEVVESLVNAKLFAGVDSGMSHIAHSVGVPTVIAEYKLPIITCHRRKHFVHARGTEEMLAAVRRMRG